MIWSKFAINETTMNQSKKNTLFLLLIGLSHVLFTFEAFSQTDQQVASELNKLITVSGIKMDSVIINRNNTASTKILSTDFVGGIKVDACQFKSNYDNRNIWYYILYPQNYDAKHKLKSLLLFSGHGKAGNLIQDSLSYQKAAGIKFAREGYLVFIMENRGMGRLNYMGDHLTVLDPLYKSKGSSWYGAIITDALVLSNEIFKRNDVDFANVSTGGVSTGGALSLFVPALDKRIKATYIQGYFGDFAISFGVNSNIHPCNHVFEDISCALIADNIYPREIIVTNGTLDQFDYIRSQNEFAKVTSFYNEKSVFNKTHFHAPENVPHEFSWQLALGYYNQILEIDKSFISDLNENSNLFRRGTNELIPKFYSQKNQKIDSINTQLFSETNDFIRESYFPFINFKDIPLQNRIRISTRIKTGSIWSDFFIKEFNINSLPNEPEISIQEYSTKINYPASYKINFFPDSENDSITSLIEIFTDSLKTNKIETFTPSKYKEKNSQEAIFTGINNSNSKYFINYVQSDFLDTSQVIKTFVSPSFNFKPNSIDDSLTLTFSEDDFNKFFISFKNIFTDPDLDNFTYQFSGLQQFSNYKLLNDSLFFSFPENYNGNIDFTVKAIDPYFLSDSVTIKIIITPINDPPVKTKPFSQINLKEDFGASDFSESITDYFSDIDSPNLTFSVNSVSNNIIISSNNIDSIRFSSLPDKNGIAFITVSASDSEFSITDTLTIYIEPVNDKPRVAAQLPSLQITEDSFDFSSPDLTQFFSDVDGDSIYISIDSFSDLIQDISVQDHGRILIRLKENLNGTGYIYFKVNDTSGESISDSVSFSISPINDPPVKTKPFSQINLKEDFGASDFSESITDYFSDIDSPNLTFSVNSVYNNIIISSNNIDSIRFSSLPDKNGIAIITVSASDSEFSITDTLTIYLEPVNDKPRVATQLPSLQIPEDSFDFSSPDLTQFFSDVDGDSIYISIDSFSDLVQDISMQDHGRILIRLKENVNGTGYIYFKVNDTSGESISDSVSFSISPINDPPVKTKLFSKINLKEDFGSKVFSESFTDYFSDIDSPNLTFSVNSVSNNIIISSNNLDSIRFSSLPDQNGIAIITVSASDSEFSITDTLTIYLEPVNDKPRVATQLPSLQIPEDSFDFSSPDLTQFFSDVDGDSIYISIDSFSDLVQDISMQEHGRILIRLKENVNGTGYIYFKVNDTSGESISDSVSFSISPINDPPENTELLFPPNNFITNNKNIEFSWKNSFDSDLVYGDSLHYELIASGDSLFHSILVDSTFLDTSHTININKESVIFWKVIVRDRNNFESKLEPYIHQFLIDVTRPSFISVEPEFVQYQDSLSINIKYNMSEIVSDQFNVTAKYINSPFNNFFSEKISNKILSIKSNFNKSGYYQYNLRVKDLAGNDNEIQSLFQLIDFNELNHAEFFNTDSTLSIIFDKVNSFEKRWNGIFKNVRRANSTIEKQNTGFQLLSKYSFIEETKLNGFATLKIKIPHTKFTISNERNIGIYLFNNLNNKYDYLGGEGENGYVETSIDK